MREKFILGKKLDNVMKGSLRIQLSNIILIKNRLLWKEATAAMTALVYFYT
jgi:hypothetical protein